MQERPHSLIRQSLGLGLLLFFLCASAAAQPPEPGLEAARTGCAPFYDDLVAKGKAVRTSDSGSPSLIPAFPGSDLVRAAIAAERPGILVETVFLLPRAAPAESDRTKMELAAIYGLLRSFSSLEGIQYYSVSHHSMRTLYAESYRIDGPETRRRLPDPPSPSASALPEAESLFAFQRDLSFGQNVYSYAFRGLQGAVMVEVGNVTKMSWGIVPIAAPGALKTWLFVVQASDAVVFYTASGAKAPGIFRSRLQESFVNRAAALFAWFTAHKEAWLGR
ncbi:MAG TPA: DUF6675 family protein [Rectinemataceae bacterium]|nr:DUF6675 family protein [Rectinemataceae bacterium]